MDIWLPMSNEWLLSMSAKCHYLFSNDWSLLPFQLWLTASVLFWSCIGDCFFGWSIAFYLSLSCNLWWLDHGHISVSSFVFLPLDHPPFNYEFNWSIWFLTLDFISWLFHTPLVLLGLTFHWCSPSFFTIFQFLDFHYAFGVMFSFMISLADYFLCSNSGSCTDSWNILLSIRLSWLSKCSPVNGSLPS